MSLAKIIALIKMFCGSGGADWNAAEGEAGHVKNRPCCEYENIIRKNSTTVARSEDSWGNPIPVTVHLSQYICKQTDIVFPEGKRIYVRFGNLKYEVTELPSEFREYITLVTFDDGYSLKYTLSKQNSPGANMDRRYYYLAVEAVPVTLSQHSYYSGTELSVELVEPMLVPLDEKYIPSSIPKVQTATVGQTVVVKAVDENGKPTEWEAADVGGGATQFYVGVNDDRYLYHDKETTMKVSQDEYRLAMFSGVVIIKTIDETCVYYPSLTAFGNSYATVSLWNDGEWLIVHTGEYVDVPPV